MEHTIIAAYPVNPTVIRCSCGKKVIHAKEGDWLAHKAGDNPGEDFPWA